MALSGSQRTRHGFTGWATRTTSFTAKAPGGSTKVTPSNLRHGLTGWVARGVTFAAKVEAEDDLSGPPIRKKRRRRFILPDGREVHSYSEAIAALEKLAETRPEPASEAATELTEPVLTEYESSLFVAPMEAIPADTEALRLQAQRERQALLELKRLRDEDDAIALLLLIN